MVIFGVEDEGMGVVVKCFFFNLFLWVVNIVG